MTVSATLDKEIEADIRKRWLAIFKPEDLNLTPEQVFNDVNFLLFQLDRYQKAYHESQVRLDQTEVLCKQNADDARASAIEARWQERQGGDYGSY